MEKDLVHIYNGLLLDHKKEWNFAICDWMDKGRRDCAKGNKLEKERKISQREKENTVWFCLYVKSKKNKTNEHTKQKQTYRFREQTDDSQWEGGCGAGWKGKGVKKFQLTVTE